MTSEARLKDNFPVHWDDPADAELTWAFDPMHYPDVVTPLGFDLLSGPLLRGFGIGFAELGIPTEIRPRLTNYYVYRVWKTASANPPTRPTSTDQSLKRTAESGARWDSDILPEVLRHIEYYRHTDFDTLSDDGLSSELADLREMRVRQGHLHTMATQPWGVAMDHLIDTYRELTGDDEAAALRLVQGYGNKSVEAGQELWRLSRLAESMPAVHQKLLEVTPESATHSLAQLEQESDARPFLEAFSSFLEKYGWRTGLLGFDAPTWAENPTVPLCQLRTYLELDGYDPVREVRRLGEERDTAIRETMNGLEPEARARMEAVLNVATELAPILEDHNFYIDQRLATMPRRLVLAVARRLVSGGILNGPADVFYLHAGEVRSALESEADDYTQIVSTRKQEMARWAQVAPPPFIGAPPPPSHAQPWQRFWGSHQLHSDQPNVLPGNGGSAGVARGPARVLLNLGEAHRLRRGDVLVARTTMPPWTPLFAVASALVVETGGILSHAAVAAREYGLPAVLGVTDATRLIRDGQLLEVDGSTGTVRILS